MKYIVLNIVSFFTISTIYQNRFYVIAAPTEYDYHNFSYSHARNNLLNNRAIILKGSHDKKITIGNEKVAKKYRSSSITSDRLQLHHILFKALRVTFPGIPYLCMQAPRTHHNLYHSHGIKTDIDYSNFTNMKKHLDDLLVSITSKSSQKSDTYSDICIQAANLAVDSQKYWIQERYSWLYSVENARSLLLAQRLLAKDCFPNNMISNKYICRQKKQYIISELHLSHYIFTRISSESPARHLKNALKCRFNMLKIYTSEEDNIPNIYSEAELNSTEVYSLANARYKNSEKFYNPISNMQYLSGESSDASSLDD